MLDSAVAVIDKRKSVDKRNGEIDIKIVLCGIFFLWRIVDDANILKTILMQKYVHW